MDAKDIMKAILSYVKMDAKPFAESLGYDRAQRIYDVLNGKTKSISMSLRADIRAKYPEFNEAWLISGEGEMTTGDGDFLKGIKANSVNGNNNNVNYGKDNVISSTDKRLLQIIENIQRENDKLLEMIASQNSRLEKYQSMIEKITERLCQG